MGFGGRVTGGSWIPAFAGMTGGGMARAVSGWACVVQNVLPIGVAWV